MNFKIKKEKLLQHLNYVIKGISNKNIRPILNCIKFELKDEGLYLSSTDNDIAIKTFISNKKIEKDYTCGKFVVFGKYIYDIVRKLPNEIISIEEVMDSKIYISTLNSSFSLNCNNVNEFPNLDLEETKEPIILNTSVFKKIISQTFFATSQNESRPLLTGINFRIENNLMEVIATDSYRLAKKSIFIDKNLDNNINIVIPGKNLLELSKILDDDDESLELHIFENKILFKYKEIVFLSRLLSGTYPATSSIIPTDFSVSVECSCNGLYEMIDRASLLTSDRDKNTIKLVLKSKELIISSNSPEIGKVEEKMAVNSEDEISISFSSKYMLDCVKSFETNTITLYMIDYNKPIIIKSNEDDSLIQLVLPIKTY